VGASRHAVAIDLVADLRHVDDQLRDAMKRIASAVKASKTTLTNHLLPSCAISDANGAEVDELALLKPPAAAGPLTSLVHAQAGSTARGHPPHSTTLEPI
jgi:hypothetical protein